MGQLIFQLIDLKQNLIFQKFEFKDQDNNIKIENAILNKAKKLRLQSS